MFRGAVFFRSRCTSIITMQQELEYQEYITRNVQKLYSSELCQLSILYMKQLHCASKIYQL